MQALQPIQTIQGDRKPSRDPSCCSSRESEGSFEDEACFQLSALGGEQACCPSDEACCGAPPGPRSSPWERPGFSLRPFVSGFVSTPSGSAPQVKTRLSRRDIWQTVLTRLGLIRNDYTVAPGLYCIGRPDENAPVLVTANYKLSFDVLRRELEGLKAWILVLDTRGINVWCAAGKELFSSAELIRQVRLSGMDRVVKHRELILPQLGATGVSGQQVKKECHFKCIWGPVRAADIPDFLENGQQADPAQREVSFNFKERLELIPVEITNFGKVGMILLALCILLSGIGPNWFSLSAAWSRGLQALGSLLVGVLAGTVAVPVLLPWIPGRAFAFKGFLVGAVCAALYLVAGPESLTVLESMALFLWIVVLSSFLGMNFTGSTPFTSPSGVEKEMKRAMPLQAGGLLLSVIFWISGAFGL